MVVKEHRNIQFCKQMVCCAQTDHDMNIELYYMKLVNMLRLDLNKILCVRNITNNNSHKLQYLVYELHTSSSQVYFQVDLEFTFKFLYTY